MENELEIFKNDEFGEVRTIIIDDKPYFVASDIAKALGYKRPSDAISAHCRYTVKHSIPHPQSKTKTMEVNIIPEGDLYRLITNSELPSAEKFESWVFDEVLPSIRKHGAYMTEQTLEKALTSPDFLIKLATQLKEEKEARQLAEQRAILAENTVEEQKPLVEFAQHVTESSDTVDVGEFSKIVKKENIDIGRNKLFVWFRDNKYLMDNNVPYQRYINSGYFKVIEIQKNTAYGINLYTKTLITGKGQVYFVEKLRKEFSKGVA